METQMNSMLDNAIKLKSTLVSALNNGNANFMALGQQADQLLTQTASVLNSTDGENYLFGGSRTNTPPVDLSELTTAATATTPVRGSRRYPLLPRRHVAATPRYRTYTGAYTCATITWR